jgi:hypothetical protein
MSLSKIKKLIEVDEDPKAVLFDLSEKLEEMKEIAKGEPGIDGKDGVDGLDGKDGKDGLDGKNGAQGEPGKDGKDGIDGIDGKNGTDGKDGKDGSPDTGEQIIEKINKLPIKPDFQIDAKHIKNLPKQIEYFGRGGGGVDTAEVVGIINANLKFADDETPTGDVDGVNTDFVLTNTPKDSSLKVYVNGSRMRLTEDYTVVDKTITFITPPPSGSIILTDYRYV